MKLLFILPCVLQAQTATLKVEDGAGVPGSTGNAVQMILENSMDVAGVQFTLSYDAEVLTLSDVKATDRTKQMDIFGWNEPEPGKVKLLVADTGGSTVGPGTWPIAVFYFDLAEGVPSGEVPLTLSDVVLSDPMGNTVAVNVVHGSFRVLYPGDFDGNWRIDFDDFFLFVDHFGLSSDNSEFEPIYDLNGDEKVDFDDFFIFVDNFGNIYPQK